MDKVKRDLQYIKLENPRDYQALLIAGKLYTENKEAEKPNEMFGRSLLAVIKDLLDKHGVKYVDDISELI